MTSDKKIKEIRGIVAEVRKAESNINNTLDYINNLYENSILRIEAIVSDTRIIVSKTQKELFEDSLIDTFGFIFEEIPDLDCLPIAVWGRYRWSQLAGEDYYFNIIEDSLYSLDKYGDRDEYELIEQMLCDNENTINDKIKRLDRDLLVKYYGGDELGAVRLRINKDYVTTEFSIEINGFDFDE